jgi:hypothetical protein
LAIVVLRGVEGNRNDDKMRTANHIPYIVDTGKYMAFEEPLQPRRVLGSLQDELSGEHLGIGKGKLTESGRRAKFKS